MSYKYFSEKSTSKLVLLQVKDLIGTIVKLLSHGPVVFSYTNLYFKKVLNFLEKSFYSYFGKLLHIQQQNIEHEIGHDVDSTCGVCVSHLRNLQRIQ